MSVLPRAGLSLLLAAATALASERLPRPEPTALPEVLETSLSELRAHPLAVLGRRVRFTLQWKGENEAYNPFASRFDPYDWKPLVAWGDEARLWIAPEYDDPARFLFVRRGGPAEASLGEAPRYGRFRATGVVREVFLGQPWIELETLEPLRELVPEGSLLHISRAIGCMKEGFWDIAIEQLERAGSAPVPAHVGAELRRMIRECALASRDLARADRAP